MITSMLRRWLVSRLGVYAKRRLASAKTSSKIIAITGSVGKSSLREAIVTGLSSSLRVLSTKENYNTDIGVPLVILGLKAAGSSWFGWLSVLRQARRLSKQSWEDAPDVIVLEFGIDHPGDMDVLRSLATPDVAVIGPIPDPPVHGEFFESAEALAEEKGKIIRGLPRNALVLVADQYPLSMHAVSCSGWEGVPIVYGWSEESAAKVEKRSIEWSDQYDRFITKGTVSLRGLSSLDSQRSYELELPSVVGLHLLDAAAASLCIVQHLGGDVTRAAKALAQLQPVPRRLEYKRTASGVHVLDDTYNASPGATNVALYMLASLPLKGRKIIVLGTMLELDKAIAEKAHIYSAKRALSLGCELVAFGVFAKAMAASVGGVACDSHEEIVSYLQQQSLTQDDVVVFKASKSVGLPPVVDAFLAT